MRFNPFEVAPDVMPALAALERTVRSPRLPAELVELVQIRVSQINGCAFCVDLHVKRALAAGEDAQRLHLLATWRHVPLYSAKERAAFAWTEELAKGAGAAMPDDVYQAALLAFGEEGLVRLTMAISVIAAWNRLAAAFRLAPPLGMTAGVKMPPPADTA